MPVTTPELLVPNIARNGTAKQSSDYKHGHFSDPDYALYAINGEFSTYIVGGARCAITKDNLYGNWWQVDLLSHFLVQKVAITTRRNTG